MAYAEGTPERELQEAMEELHRQVDKVVRLNGSIRDGFYISDWAVVGSATRIDEDPSVVMFALPGTTMLTYQLHGLLSYVDQWIMDGEYDEEESDDSDDGEDTN